MRLLKRAIPFYTSAPMEAIPVAYWRILFPQMYWTDIKADAERNGLDPYMVASLIRQETEFNPGAVSNKNAWGSCNSCPRLAALSPKTKGSGIFQNQRAARFPRRNIRLGTLYLKQTLDKFGASLNTPSPPTTQETIALSTGRVSAITTASRSLWSPSPSAKPANTSKPSCAKNRSTAELDKLTAQRAHADSRVLSSLFVCEGARLLSHFRRPA